MKRCARYRRRAAAGRSPPAERSAQSSSMVSWNNLLRERPPPRRVRIANSAMEPVRRPGAGHPLQRVENTVGAGVDGDRRDTAPEDHPILVQDEQGAFADALAV